MRTPRSNGLLTKFSTSPGVAPAYGHITIALLIINVESSRLPNFSKAYIPPKSIATRKKIMTDGLSMEYREMFIAD